LFARGNNYCRKFFAQSEKTTALFLRASSRKKRCRHGKSRRWFFPREKRFRARESSEIWRRRQENSPLATGKSRQRSPNNQLGPCGGATKCCLLQTAAWYNSARHFGADRMRNVVRWLIGAVVVFGAPPAIAGLVVTSYHSLAQTRGFAPTSQMQYFAEQRLENITPADAHVSGDWTGDRKR
jgi:hypothetical protein